MSGAEIWLLIVIVIDWREDDYDYDYDYDYDSEKTHFSEMLPVGHKHIISLVIVVPP
jgi:hypothetical protein